MTKKIKNKKRKLLLSTLSLVVLVLVLVSGGVIWNGNKAKAAGVTVVGDTVTISGFMQVYLSPTDTQYDGKNLILKNSSTLTLDGTHTFKNVTIDSISTVTSNKQMKLELHADNITLTNGGRIDVSGKGYDGGKFCPWQRGYVGSSYNTLPISGYDIWTQCRGQGSGGGFFGSTADQKGANGGGGSYGGKGGIAGRDSAQSGTYGDANFPNDYGSGGGSGIVAFQGFSFPITNYSEAVVYYNGNYMRAPTTAEKTVAGAGGGIVHLYVNGTLDIDSTSLIKSNGGNGVIKYDPGSGGGSGGSIYVETGILKVAQPSSRPGTEWWYNSAEYSPFVAAGGLGGYGGYNQGSMFNGSGGGGGRIAIKAGLLYITGQAMSLNTNETYQHENYNVTDIRGGLNWDGSMGGSYGKKGTAILLKGTPPKPNQPPVAIITGPTTTLTGATNTFVGSGSYDPDGVVVLHSWNISPITINYVDATDPNSQNPHIRFNAPGTYTVRLTVADNLGATGFTTKTITVVDPVTINVNIVRPAGMAASAGGYDIDYNGASFSSSEIGNRIFPNQPSGLWKINPKAAAGYTVVVTSTCSPTACASVNPQTIAPGGTLTFTVTYTSNTQTFTCPAKPAGADWNTVSSYTQTWNGATWVPANSTTNYNTTASTTSCNYKCSTNYTWNGSACVSLVTVNVIVNKPAGMTTGAGYDIIGNGQLVASNTISATYTGASGSWGVGAHVPPAGYSVTVSPPWYQNIAAGESFNFIVTYNLISTSSGLSFIPKVTRGGQTISGTNITILPSATDPINTFEICTDKTKCQNPVRIGDLVDITAFLILAGTAGDPFMGGTASYTSTCKLVDPNKNITLNKDCNGESNRTKSGTGTGIGRKFNFILSQSGKMEIKITGNDGLGSIVTKAIIIRVPAIGTLE